jgi:hypothetical protein
MYLNFFEKPLRAVPGWQLWAWFKRLFSRTPNPPPVLLSCHYRIEDREGYEQYLEAKRLGWGELPCRFLGSWKVEHVRLEFIDPSRFDPPDPKPRVQ